MSEFNLSQFLEENTVKGGSGKVDVLPTKLEAGLGVFAGRSSKLFPLNTNDEKETEKAKNEAASYLKNCEDNGFIAGAVEQIWYTTEFLTRDPYKSDWTEMKRPVMVTVNGEEMEAGDWALFRSQFAGDNPVLDPATHFGKKLWVKAAMRPHPDFDKENPNKYTTQVDRDATAAAGGETQWEKNDDGEYVPTFIRVVTHVFKNEAEARAFVDGDGENDESGGDSGLEQDLKDLMPDNWAKEYDADTWLPIAKELFDSFHDGAKLGALASEWEGSVDKPTLMKISKLTKTYPPL